MSLSEKRVPASHRSFDARRVLFAFCGSHPKVNLSSVGIASSAGGTSDVTVS